MAYGGKSAVDVLLTTEGTYPMVRGGVSTWCDMLVRGAERVNYSIYTIIGTPHLPTRYTVPRGVRVIRVPMWGTEEPTEHLDIRFSTVYERKLRTTAKAVQGEFIPLLDDLLDSILGNELDGRSVGQLLFQLYLFFHDFDYLEAFKHGAVWDFYVDNLIKGRWAKHHRDVKLADALQSMGWLYRFLMVLNTPVPKTDVIHSSASAFCGVPGVLGKLEHKTPYMLTEHGVYLREQYLSIGRSPLSTFAKEFLLGLVRNVSNANYAHADLIAPVAAFNARWERRFGVPEDKIRVIYNGVDPKIYTPRPRPQGAPPTVVSVARVDPVKDIMTLMRSAALVKQQMPEAKFVVYGGVSVPSYYRQCLELKDELGLQDSFVFAGHVSDVPSAYASGDVVGLSSITEGFPYAVIEAMMSGRPVVATDVGGTKEACGTAGLVVPPKHPEAMAAAFLKLLRDPGLRAALAEEGRERALSYFTIQRNLTLYRQAYEELAQKVAPAEVPDLVARRRLLAIDRAQALTAAGRFADAIREYRLAADLDPEGPNTPALVLQIAQLYLEQGDLEKSWVEMERAEALAAATGAKSAA